MLDILTVEFPERYIYFQSRNILAIFAIPLALCGKCHIWKCSCSPCMEELRTMYLFPCLFTLREILIILLGGHLHGPRVSWTQTIPSAGIRMSHHAGPIITNTLKKILPSCDTVTLPKLGEAKGIYAKYFFRNNFTHFGENGVGWPDVPLPSMQPKGSMSVVFTAAPFTRAAMRDPQVL